MRRRLGLLAGGLAVVAWVCAACASPAAAPASAAKLRDTRYVLLGEVHDNPAHHLERAELLRTLLADGRPTRVLFEQMPLGTEAAIAAAPRDADAVAEAGRLDRRAWGWPLHRPLVQAALDGGAAIAGANLERDALRAVMRDGTASLSPGVQSLLAKPWSSRQQAAQAQSIDAGHCGLLPPDRLPAMVLSQRARDAAMAQAMLQARPGERVVLIAGNGHVRGDIGVPHYLRAAGVPEAAIVTMGWLEEGRSEQAGAFDAIRSTRATPRPDPCKSLR